MALTNLKRMLDGDDKDSKQICRVLSIRDNPIYREKIFDANFVRAGKEKTAFEISLVYLCRLDPDLFDKSKKRVLMKQNRLGGVDAVEGTIPADSYVFIVAWLTLVKPIGKVGENDWSVQRFEPMSTYVPKKILD